MRTDLYTKAVLTLIAGALVYLCVALTPIGTPVSAQAGASHVRITGWVDDRGGVHALTADEGLPVRLGTMASFGAAAPAAGGAAAAPRALASTPRAPAAAPSSDQRVRCQATTQRGSQCSRMAPAGQRYCWQHAR